MEKGSPCLCLPVDCKYDPTPRFVPCCPPAIGSRTPFHLLSRRCEHYTWPAVEIDNPSLSALVDLGAGCVYGDKKARVRRPQSFIEQRERFTTQGGPSCHGVRCGTDDLQRRAGDDALRRRDRREQEIELTIWSEVGFVRHIVVPAARVSWKQGCHF